jgi:hypothetical protein
MIIGYARPSSISWSVSGTGASFLSDVVLSNGRPADTTQIQWITSASPITDYLDLRGVWSTSQNVRVACLLGMTYSVAEAGSPTTFTRTHVPAGVRVVATGRRLADAGYTYALGGNSTTARTVQLPDGTTACWFVFDAGLDFLIGIQFRIYNDDDAETWMSGRDYFEIGEAEVFAGAEVGATPGWTMEWTDPTEVTRTLAGQVHRVARQSWREYDIGVVAAGESSVRASGLQNSQDYEKIANALRYSVPCAFIPQYTDTAGVLDENVLNRLALFAVATPRPLTHLEKRIYSHGYRVAELPAAGTLPA